MREELRYIASDDSEFKTKDECSVYELNLEAIYWLKAGWYSGIDPLGVVNLITTKYVLVKK